MKRLVDFLGALGAIIVLAPVMLLLALVIRIHLGKPIVFRQVRPGRHGRPFVLHKFRTMRDAVDADGVPLPDEERLVPFGAWLRSTSLDELPELFDVLGGALSLVGPRPLLMEYLPLYTPEQARRLEAKPGITGWAQVNGRNRISWEEKFRLDVWYVDHASFWLDLRILMLTVARVLRRDGISQEHHVTAEPFLGSKVGDGPHS